MTERVSRAVVNFAEPFFVEGLDCYQPAGTYEVETVEERIEWLSFIAYRVMSMSIVLPRRGGGRYDCQLARIAASVVEAARLDADKIADAQKLQQSNPGETEQGTRSD
jgi:hypothetical protein